MAIFKSGRVATVGERELERGSAAEKLRESDPAKMSLMVLRCARRLPASSTLRLVWGKGVESLSGIQTAQDQVIEFKVRPGFSANFSCQRVNRDAGCLPFMPMQLSFTAPVSRVQAEKMVLRGAEGKTVKPKLPELSQNGEFVQEVTFEGPLPEQATFKLEIPTDLRDDANRKLNNQKRFPLTVKTDASPPLHSSTAYPSSVATRSTPDTTSTKNGLYKSGMMIPSEYERLCTSARAITFGRYPNSSAARKMRSRVASATRTDVLPPMTSETSG